MKNYLLNSPMSVNFVTDLIIFLVNDSLLKWCKQYTTFINDEKTENACWESHLTGNADSRRQTQTLCPKRAPSQNTQIFRIFFCL